MQMSFHRSSSQIVCVCVCLFDVPFHVLDFEAYLPPLPKVRCPKFLEIRNPWGKVLGRSGLIIVHFCYDVVLNCRVKEVCYC